MICLKLNEILNTGYILPDTVNNLNINNSVVGLTLSKTVTVNGMLEMQNGALKLNSVGSSQTLFPVSTSSGYAPVWITNHGIVDTIGVSVENDATPAPFGGRVRVKWNIIENIAGGGNHVLQFGWMALLENTAFRADRESNARKLTGTRLILIQIDWPATSISLN